MSSTRLLAGISVVIPAAGSGRRMASDIPKQHLKLNGHTVLEVTLNRMLALGPDRLVLVVAAADHEYGKIPALSSCEVIHGGKERSDSVKCGLAALSLDRQDFVMVHDAVRPCVRTMDVQRLVDGVRSSNVGGLLAVPVVDTLKASENNSSTETVSRTVDRRDLWQAQTPQLFRYGVLCDAMDKAQASGHVYTDESGALEDAGFHPVLIPGHRDNIKITEPGDLELACFFLETTCE